MISPIHRSRFLVLLLLCFFACPLLSSAYAQGIITGSLSGTITDPSGAIVPNADVKVSNVDTGVQTTGTTNSKGEISFKDLPLGKYTVIVQGSGFRPLRSTTSRCARVRSPRWGRSSSPSMRARM